MDQNNEIVKYVIKSSPIGHLPQALDNLRNLIGKEIIESTPIQDEIKNYEEQHFQSLKVNDDTKIVISTFNKEDQSYEDQIKKIRVQISPLTENVQSVEEISEPIPSLLRDDIYKYLEEYRLKNFKPEISVINGKFHYELSPL